MLVFSSRPGLRLLPSPFSALADTLFVPFLSFCTTFRGLNQSRSLKKNKKVLASLWAFDTFCSNPEENTSETESTKTSK
jgi:hypothetical protein